MFSTNEWAYTHGVHTYEYVKSTIEEYSMSYIEMRIRFQFLMNNKLIIKAAIFLISKKIY